MEPPREKLIVPGMAAVTILRFGHSGCEHPSMYCGPRLQVSHFLGLAAIVLLNGEPDLFTALNGSVNHGVQFVEFDPAAPDVVDPFGDPWQQAPFGILVGITRMDTNAGETRNIEHLGQLALEPVGESDHNTIAASGNRGLTWNLHRHNRDQSMRVVETTVEIFQNVAQKIAGFVAEVSDCGECGTSSAGKGQVHGRYLGGVTMLPIILQVSNVGSSEVRDFQYVSGGLKLRMITNKFNVSFSEDIFWGRRARVAIVHRL